MIDGNIVHKKEIEEMGHNDNDINNIVPMPGIESSNLPQNGKNEQVSSQNNPKKDKGEKSNKKQFVIKISAAGVIGVMLTILFSCTAAVWVLGEKFEAITNTTTSLGGDVEELSDDFSRMEEQFTEMQLQSSEMHTYLYYDGGVKDQLGDIIEALNLKVVNVPDDSAYAPIKSTVKEVRMAEATAPSAIIPTSTIGLYEDGKPCYAKDVINEPILLTYTEGTKEIYFYGTLNKKYQWNGYCVTNVYFPDGSLSGICESNFENGKRLDYKSLYLSDTGEWIYSDKNCENEGNIGINISYSFTYEKNKNFTSTNVRITDILYADKVLESVNPKMLTYYSGKTAKGLFNDDSGHAYEVIYDDDGNVKTLYVGRFSGGAFHDQTGEAWDIAYTEEYGFYVHNTGIFENNGAIKKSKDPISIEKILEIISDYNFECELNWKQD